jgi:hypothetical protein
MRCRNDCSNWKLIIFKRRYRSFGDKSGLMKNHTEFSRKGQKKHNTESFRAKATDHKGARPHGFHPPFSFFPPTTTKAHPLGLSSHCCHKTAMKSLFATSQLTVLNLPALYSSTYRQVSLYDHSQQNRLTSQSDELSPEPLTLFPPILITPTLLVNP